jgi:glycerol-3-phosphate dehydrogenase (NAD(P)+)
MMTNTSPNFSYSSTEHQAVSPVVGNKIAILGGGSWGLTLAWLATNQCKQASDGSIIQNNIVLWDRTPEKIEQFKTMGKVEFPVALTLPTQLTLTSNLAEAVAGAEAILFVVTSKATRMVAEQIKALNVLSSTAILINASKGIEFPSLKPMSTVLKEVFPSHRVGVLSGPTLAKEILAGLPTAATVAAEDLETAEWLQARLNCNERFRLYTNTDLVGVELAGALKNVFAIASGYMAAKNMGDNARAALLTRGLAEMARFCLKMGAEMPTIYGLSGLGDLLATCNSPLSRNYQVGYRLGKGETLAEILADLKVVAEGVQTALAVYELAKQLEMDTPIVELVVNAINGQVVSGEMMIKSLMSRKLKQER